MSKPAGIVEVNRDEMATLSLLPLWCQGGLWRARSTHTTHPTHTTSSTNTLQSAVRPGRGSTRYSAKSYSVTYRARDLHFFNHHGVRSRFRSSRRFQKLGRVLGHIRIPFLENVSQIRFASIMGDTGSQSQGGYRRFPLLIRPRKSLRSLSAVPLETLVALIHIFGIFRLELCDPISFTLAFPRKGYAGGLSSPKGPCS